MNKELIKKYKTEFDHWLNGGKILTAIKLESNIGNWEEVTNNNNWNNHNRVYVINDSYSVYRKALAEGKTVQVDVNYWAFPNTDIKNYQDLPKGFTNWNKYEVSCYRIKPKEPKFKVDDWLVNEKPPYNCGKEPSRPFQVEQDWLDHITKFGETYGGNTSRTGSLENFKYWKPKPGEWCWFFNKDRIPTISQFVEMEEEKYFASYPNKPHQLGSWYAYCEPFFGKLPTHLQV